MELPFVFSKEGKTRLTVHAKIFDDWVLAWLAT
jgi:hypothetical protein